MRVALITVDQCCGVVVTVTGRLRGCIRYCGRRCYSWWCRCRSKVMQIQELLSQNPSFALRDVTKPISAQSSQAVAGSCKFLKRASDEVSLHSS